jgi:V/A-type H+-transporting ATPase subunit I
MIVPMKKLALVVRDKDQVAALTKLREIGVVHLEKTKGSSDALAMAVERKTRGDTAWALI